jgi:hypothetical protein
MARRVDVGAREVLFARNGSATRIVMAVFLNVDVGLLLY